MTQESMSFVDFMTILGILFGAYYLWFSTILKESKTRSSLIAKLRSYDAMPFYRDRLSSVLDKFDNALGKPKFSFSFFTSNILFHYGLSIFYILFVFLFIWLFGGIYSGGTLVIMPEIHSWEGRLFLLSKLIIFISIVIFVYSNIFEIFLKKYIKSKIIRILVVGMLVGVAIVIVVEIGKVSIGVIIKGGVIGVFKLGTLVGVGVFGVVVGRLLGGGLPGILGVGVFSIGIFGTSSILHNGNFFTTTNSSLFIFLLLIPFLNTLLDFLSLTLSRIFFRYIAKGEEWYKIMLHLFLDLLLAILFMLGLAALLYYSISYYNSLVDSSLHIPITNMLQSTLKEPFSLDNAWITFMLLSTLIPTVLHLIFAILNFVLYVTKLAPWYANRIEKNKKYASQRMFTAFIMSLPVALISIVVVYMVYIGFIKFMNLFV